MKFSECIIDIIDNRGRNPDYYVDSSNHPILDNYLIKNTLYPQISNANRFLDDKLFNSFLRGYVKNGMVVMTLVGNGIGNVTTINNENIAIIQNTIGFVTNPKKVTDRFLYYYFLHNQQTIKNFDRGSGQPSIKRTDLLNMEVEFPSLENQQKITAILSSLDDKIELNNKINENLEQQAQALFKSWFIDFEPFGGKMPEGWKEEDIYSIANIIYGSPFASKLFNTEKNGKPIIRIRDLKDQHSDVYTPEERDDAYLIQPKDIVVGMDGEFRPYIWGSEPGWLNQRVCVFENKRPKGKAFLYFSIKPLLDVVEKHR